MCALIGHMLFPVSEACAAEEDSLSMAVGIDYSSGKYGSADTTDILSIPVSGMYKSGSWLLKLTVPYIRISGKGDVLPRGIRTKSTTTTKDATHSGMGDVVAAVTYSVNSIVYSGLVLDLTGKVKFGTTSTLLGTGENDYIFQVNVYQNIARFTPMVALGYEVLGSPAGVDLNNVVYGLLGGQYKFTSHISGGMTMRISQRFSVIGAEQRELTAYMERILDESVKASVYVLKGFSDGSPDIGFGVLVSSAF